MSRKTLHQRNLHHYAFNIGITDVDELTEAVGCHRTTTNRFLQRHGLLKRAPRPRRPPVLTLDQRRTLFAATSVHDLIPLRLAVKEMFGIDILDATLKRYIYEYQVTGLPKKSAISQGRPALFTDAEIDVMARHFQEPYAPAVSWKSVLGVAQSRFQRTMSRAAAYKYAALIKERMKCSSSTSKPLS